MSKRNRYTPGEVEAIRLWWGAKKPLGVSSLTESDICLMRSLWEDGYTQAEIAGQFGTTQRHVSRLLQGVILPGWRGARMGRGRPRPVIAKRRRNTKKTEASKTGPVKGSKKRKR